MAIVARRRFIGGLAAAGAAGVIATPRVRAAEAPLETTTVRLGYIPAACDAPVHAADDLLHVEGYAGSWRRAASFRLERMQFVPVPE